MIQNTIVRSAKPGDSNYHLHDNHWTTNKFGSGLLPNSKFTGDVNIMSVTKRSRLRNVKISKTILKQMI